MTPRNQTLRSMWRKILSVFKPPQFDSGDAFPAIQVDDSSRNKTDQLAYFQSHPPRCLDAFKVSLVESDDASVGGHGEELSTVYQVSTPSGVDAFRIRGNLWNNPSYGNVFMWPIKLQCVSCDEPELLFDLRQHGYDAECDWSPAEEYGDASLYVCPDCQGEMFKVEVAFSYPDDLFDEGDFADNQHNLFTWIAFTGTCTQCGTKQQIVDYECS